MLDGDVRCGATHTISLLTRSCISLLRVCVFVQSLSLCHRKRKLLHLILTHAKHSLHMYADQHGLSAVSCIQ